jgi:hypothetical protein
MAQQLARHHHHVGLSGAQDVKKYYSKFDVPVVAELT